MDRAASCSARRSESAATKMRVGDTEQGTIRGAFPLGSPSAWAPRSATGVGVETRGRVSRPREAIFTLIMKEPLCVSAASPRTVPAARRPPRRKHQRPEKDVRRGLLKQEMKKNESEAHLNDEALGPRSRVGTSPPHHVARHRCGRSRSPRQQPPGHPGPSPGSAASRGRHSPPRRSRT